MSLVAAEATTLQEIKGGVLVSRGEGYTFVHGPTQLNIGDSVIANPDGAAKIVYADGCVVPIEAGVVVSVGPTSPCIETGSLPQTQAQPHSDFGITTSTLVIGGLVVGGAVAAAVLLTGQDDDAPASP